jgi:AraC-like DNA-binding protein
MQLAPQQLPAARELTALTELLERLLDLTREKQSSPCIRVRARNAHTLGAVDMDMPLLALPLQGRKRVREENRWIHIAPGQIFLVPHPTAIDIENIPDEATGCYTAISIPLEEHVLSAARQLVREPAGAGRGGVACVPLDIHVEDLTHWLNAMKQGDLARACYSVVGVVLKLYAQGHRSLLYPPVPSLSGRIRAMVAADPTQEWSSANIEANIGMSGATLRRHLAVEGLSLRLLIGNARLSHGLSLLLTTRLPVKTVAQRVGYASVSTFVKRFRERYGVEPSRVGGVGGL